MTEQMKSSLGQIDGPKKIIITGNKGNDSCTLVALYVNTEDQEAAEPKAAELPGFFVGVLAAPVESMQVDAPINFIF